MDPAKLLAAVRDFLRAHGKAARMTDLLRTHAAEHGDIDAPDSELRGLLKESERLDRAQDYSLSSWLEDVAAMAEEMRDLQREALEDFPGFWRWMQSAAERGRIRPIPVLRRALQEATPAEVAACAEAMRKEAAAMEELVRELRSAAQRLTDDAVARAGARRRRRP